MKYNLGEEVPYDYSLIKPEDYEKLQAFTCGNEKLDKYIHQEIIQKGVVQTEDGLLYKVVNTDNNSIIGVVSLATSGILWEVGKYTKIFPAIKIDVFAIDTKYQKMHYDEESKNSSKPKEHYYFSDDVMGHFIMRCRKISKEYAHSKYIILYADKKAYRFYDRNFFKDFSKFMKKENNMEINKNIPMYMEI